MDDLDRILKELPAAEQAAIERRVQELTLVHNLRELRALAGKTQQDVAATAGVKQNNVSRLERQADMKLSTLNDYVESLGGSLRIVVEISGKKVDLSAMAKRAG